MIKDLIQMVLDTALVSENIRVYDQLKTGADLDSYIVYSLSGDSGEFFTDDEVMAKNASITVKYYYRTQMLDNYVTRKKVRTIEDLIEASLEEANIKVPFGRFDGGDVDGIGYYTTIFECEYWRVI